jgi:protein-S-isoprenylcysteine O-methyltransferase Ste14
MIEILILTITCAMFAMLSIAIGKSIVHKQPVFGRPAIPLLFFIQAKLFAFIILVFLLLRGFNVRIGVVYTLPAFFDFIALAFLFIGVTLVCLTSFRLKRDLVFGLSDSSKHTLQTGGVYSISRHPFYLGFLLVLLSSVLFVPNIFNIILFVLTWIFHHFIMNKEEEHLTVRYGEEYKRYMKKVKRYMIF